MVGGSLSWLSPGISEGVKVGGAFLVLAQALQLGAGGGFFSGGDCSTGSTTCAGGAFGFIGHLFIGPVSVAARFGAGSPPVPLDLPWD